MKLDNGQPDETKPQAETMFHLALTETQVSQLLAALGEAPAKHSSYWIQAITDTCRHQLEVEKKTVLHTV